MTEPRTAAGRALLREWRRMIAIAAMVLGGILIVLAFGSVARAGDGDIDGTASWYGPGSGVATHWCTWVYRHQHGCGSIAVRSAQTGITVISPVIDYCEACRWTPGARLVDLQWGVVVALGLERAQGVYPVTVWRVGGERLPNTAYRP